MIINTSKRFVVLGLVYLTSALTLTSAIVRTQAPAGAPPQTQQGAPGGGGGRGRGGLPGATPAQTQAVIEMNAAIAPFATAVTTARNELATATFAEPRSDAGIKSAIEKLRAAELALATNRADQFEKLQAGPNKLNADQVTALIAAGGNPGGGGRGGRGGTN